MRIPMSCLSLVCAVSIAVADESEKPSPADQLKALVKEREDKLTELGTKARAATEAADRTAIIRELTTFNNEYATKLLKFAQDHSDDEVGLEAALQVMALSNRTTTGPAIDLILDKYADSPKLLSVIPMLVRSPAGEKALDTLAEKGGSPEIRGIAKFALFEKQVQDADYGMEARSRSPEESVKVFEALREKLDDFVTEYGELKTGPAAGSPTIKDASKKLKFFLDNLTIGSTAPDFETELLDGEKAKLSDYRGKVVVLDVWATWCGPCRAMIPHEREMVGKLKDRPFELISVSCDEEKATLEKFLEKEEMPWTHFWVGRGGKFHETYQVRFYPTIYILDTKGVIRYKHLRGEQMEEAVEKLIEEAEKSASGG